VRDGIGGRKRTERTGIEDFDAGDLASEEEAFEASSDGLDLG
jgi:hypothetical protein